MKRDRRIWLLAGCVLASLAACYVGRIGYIWWHIPEAYAAWDAGDMMVWYMNTHDNSWPQSWDQLTTAVESEPALYLRGRHPDEPDYMARMRDTIAIDWSFDPANPVNPHPITRADGTALHAYWEDPNGMVYQHINRLAEQ